MMVETSTERPNRFLGPERAKQFDDELLHSLLDSGWPELEVLGSAMAVLLPDRPIVRRLRSRPLPPSAPGWAHTMDSIEVTGTHAQFEPLDDGVNLWVSVRWPDGSEATAIIFVDHNMNSMVKDAFVLPMGATEVMSAMRGVSDDAVELTPFDPADLRARYEWSVGVSDRSDPPFETETWPSCRPLVEWMVGHLPSGGQAWQFPTWSAGDRDKLAEEFVVSPFGRSLRMPTPVVRSVAEHLIRHGCDTGSGDPLRWSPVVVEVVLLSWFPHTVGEMTDDEIEAVPLVIEQFVAFAHDRRGMDPDATRVTQSSIVTWEDEFFLAMYGGTDEADDDYMQGVVSDLEQQVIEMVGGREEYERLDDEPLEDIAFDWSVVPADMSVLAGDTLGLIDEWSSRPLDAEVRSIARLVLAGVLVNDRSVFKRSARTDVLAAAILGYVLRRVGNTVDRGAKGQLGWAATSVAGLAEVLGLPSGTVNARVKTVTNVMDRAALDWSKYLHSAERRNALSIKEHITQFRGRDEG